MRLDHDDIKALVKLANGDGINDNISSFDYISAIYNDANQWVVEVFIEPVGVIKVQGRTLRYVIEFWLELFRSQPEDWDYSKAGRHLEKFLQLRSFEWEAPKDARRVWLLEDPT
jgi:hypothetical protein